ncbi:MAG TPA: hypothetical protein VFR74_09150 [Jiangellales bacterium]|nr:hypothetical protein [Jiangellales bacterium]
MGRGSRWGWAPREWHAARARALAFVDEVRTWTMCVAEAAPGSALEQSFDPEDACGSFPTAPDPTERAAEQEGADSGPPASVGPSEGAGPPDTARPPDSPGPTDGAGPPETAGPPAGSGK